MAAADESAGMACALQKTILPPHPHQQLHQRGKVIIIAVGVVGFAQQPAGGVSGMTSGFVASYVIGEKD